MCVYVCVCVHVCVCLCVCVCFCSGTNSCWSLLVCIFPTAQLSSVRQTSPLLRYQGSRCLGPPSLHNSWKNIIIINKENVVYRLKLAVMWCGVVVIGRNAFTFNPTTNNNFLIFSQFPEVIWSLMVASNKQSQNWSPLFSSVVLVECLHVAILWRARHATEILIITNRLYTCRRRIWRRRAQRTSKYHLWLDMGESTWKSPQQMRRSILHPSLCSAAVRTS